MRAIENELGIEDEPGIGNIDPALFGLWPERAAYDGTEQGGEAAGWSEGECRRQSALVLLEIKSAEVPPEDLRLLLNDMTREMREQFDHFRKLRATAELLCGPDADEAAAKLARSDIKAATDAMSLIVRTLEKVDALQRQLARDRETEAERNAESLGYDEKKQLLSDLVEKRVNERVAELLKQRQPDLSAPGKPDLATQPGSVQPGLDHHPGPGSGPDSGAGPPEGHSTLS